MASPAAPHLLVTNDFPPKVGGIQSYLWELWRRLPAGSAVVLTTAQDGASAFDAHQPFPVRRLKDRVLLPTPALVRRVEAVADDVGARLVILDPALPVGLIGRRLSRPYAIVLHGAEVTVPGRLPGTRSAMSRVLRGARLVVAAGGYPADEAARVVGGRDRLPPVTIVPPGVDVDRFRPLGPFERAAARARFGLPVDARLVLSVSRLVPRKGMDVLVEAAVGLAPSRPELFVAIAGEGRDRHRLDRLIRDRRAPARLLGRVGDSDLPALYGAADVFAMCCRNRWGGLEQEGFGIVFLEAAACGVPQVAGSSGGAAEAVVHGTTGLVVDRPADPAAVGAAIGSLLDNAERRSAFGAAARARAETDFAYPLLARRLHAALAPLLDGPP